ncbi:hypothetical protein VFMJ11_B0178 (plasmid) [Aliivibrio fischeri MJ11]|uniref:Uncharacterized protein n=1 Tax=Aliivibrio fischeri (strain MJ11) TaxID=388396 RepID=B5EWC1_ALIFM|nr:hypothetical protein VFMJ11_B0178 [Aliivibrio fischeri MJ11]
MYVTDIDLITSGLLLISEYIKWLYPLFNQTMKMKITALSFSHSVAYDNRSKLFCSNGDDMQETLSISYRDIRWRHVAANTIAFSSWLKPIADKE